MKIKDLLKTKFNDQDLEYLFAESANYSIFAIIAAMSGAPEWCNSSTKARALTFDYYINHSGEKTLARFPRYMVENYPITYATGTNVPSFRFNDKIVPVLMSRFAKNWAKLYEAIYADYDPIENYRSEETETYNTDTQTDTNAKIYGFDSTSPVPVSEAGTHSTGDKTNNERHLTRAGNIGVTTSQQMIESEIELRKQNFLEIVYRDIDSMLALAIYE